MHISFIDDSVYDDLRWSTIVIIASIVALGLAGNHGGLRQQTTNA